MCVCVWGLLLLLCWLSVQARCDDLTASLSSWADGGGGWFILAGQLHESVPIQVADLFKLLVAGPAPLTCSGIEHAAVTLSA